MILGAVLAGGSGSRMGSEMPKQFLPLCGKPMLIRTLEPFFLCKEIEKILVAVPEDWRTRTAELVQSAFGSPERFETIAGGGDRTESLMLAAARAAELDGSDDAILGTHDGARPFITPELILQTVQAACETGGATAAIPAVDTIAVAGGGVIDRIPDRSSLWQIQTPQTFRLALLRRAAASLSSAERDGLTDACGIFVARGLPVRLVAGSHNNLKLTTPDDLFLAEALLRSTADNLLDMRCRD